MRSSIDDNESFMEAAGSLRFNNPPSDLNTLQQEPLAVSMGNSGMQHQEGSEDNNLSSTSSNSSIIMPPNLSDLELEKSQVRF